MEIKEEIKLLLNSEIPIRIINDMCMPSMGQRGQWNLVVVPNITTLLDTFDENKLIEIKSGLQKILDEFNDEDGFSESLDQFIEWLL